MLKWEKAAVSIVAGEIALLAGLSMWATTFPRIRRNMFELFFYTHYLYIIFALFFVLHIGISYACMMLPGFYLFMVDRYLRFLQSRQRVRLVSARTLPCETVELNFSKSKGIWLDLTCKNQIYRSFILVIFFCWWDFHFFIRSYIYSHQHYICECA